MFYNSSAFKALEAGVQLSSMKQQINLQNLANLETPGYKSKSLDFETVLQASNDQGRKTNKIRASIVTDENTTARVDGNNVDFEKENIEMYKSYVQYSALLNKIKGQFDNYSYVLNNSMK